MMTSPRVTVRVRPNRYSLALAAILFCMWYVGAAQENGSAYVLVFLAATLAAISWFHARANLRAVNIRAGAVRSVEEGQLVCLPLVLTAGEGRVPCGLELTLRGAVEPVFIESLNAVHPVAATLRVAAMERGPHAGHAVLVRSYYPLGFFTATRVVEVQQARLVHPRGAGDMPLPEPAADTSPQAMSLDALAAAGRVLGDGDDFAGLREWRTGESLRQVDWKAVARGRPLLVKQYEGAPQSAVWLDADAVPLPQEAMLSQLAKWVREAESKGLRYGLRLPSTYSDNGVALTFLKGQPIIEPSNGPEHERRCLDALASVRMEHDGKVDGIIAKTSRQRVKAPPSGESAANVPGQPLLLLCLALLLAALPFIGTVAWPSLLAFAMGLLLRWQWHRSGRSAVPQWLRLLLVTLGVAGAYWVEGTFIGIEAGTALMLCVTAGKLLEARSPRDMQVVALLGWFLCVCAVAVDQGLGHSLYSFAVLLLIAAVLVRFRRGVAGVFIPLKVTAGLLAQAMPFVVLLFFVFPRGSGGLVTQLSRRLMHRTGMSSHLDPGSVASIAKSTDRVFRATVTAYAGADDQVQFYWRCLVLWQCDGLRWDRGDSLGEKQREAGQKASELRQTILLEPHGDVWMPALDWPVRLRGGSEGLSVSYSDMTVRSLLPSTGMRRYEVASRPSLSPYELPETLRIAALRLPPVPPKVLALAQSLQVGGRTSSQIVEAALDYFREQGFRYTIEPGAYSRDGGLEEFLFQRREGFCEHYAASFATLMRLAGVPSRVVVGYLGGDFNAHGNYTLVRQSDAHAWTEVWLDGIGWSRVDPTAALVPARLNSDLRTFMEGGLESAFAQNKNTWWGQGMNEVLLLWDNINYQWYERVVQFDDIAQMDLFAEWGLLRRRAGTVLAVLLLVVGTLGLGVELWLRRRSRHPDAAVRVWQKFCRRLAKAGVPRVPSEGPMEFAERAAIALPNAAERIRRIAELYAEMRYGRKALEIADLQGEVNAMVL